MADERLPIIHRNPEWRMVWDELDKPLQREVRRTIRRGQAMTDPGHAAVAAGAAIRWRRELTIQGVVSVILGAAMAVALWSIKPSNPNFFYWLQCFVAATWLLIGPTAGVFWRRRAISAERANRKVVNRGSLPVRRTTSAGAR
ncbi:MAG: hypothetical protein M3N53_13010 [Actinomycetota bacterium]|nr:hypothetical protein [Actinomycetota bacterium]